jgi:hypothetical protein
MIAASVQCDVDGIPKGAHYVRVPPTGVLATMPFAPADRLLVHTSVRLTFSAPPSDTGVQQRPREGAQRLTRPSAANASLGS